MACQRCSSKRVADLTAKCSDRCFIQINDNNSSDYVPNDMGIGGGDYVGFEYCLNCGQIQGSFPLPLSKLEEYEEEDTDN